MSMATLAIIAGVAVYAFAGEEKEEAVSMDKVPQKVKDTLKQYAADTDVKTVEMGDQDGTKVYEFDIEQGARKFEVAITPDGKFNRHGRGRGIVGHARRRAKSPERRGRPAARFPAAKRPWTRTTRSPTKPTSQKTARNPKWPWTRRQNCQHRKPREGKRRKDKE